MAETRTPIISFKNFSFQYRAQKQPTLHDINLDKDNYALMFSGYDGVHFCTEGATSPAYEGTRYNQNDALGSNDGMILTQVQNGAWTIVYPTEYNNGQDNINY